MITRLMFSLRKAAYSQGSVWSMGESTLNRSPGREAHSVRFASKRDTLNGRDDDTLLSPITSGV